MAIALKGRWQSMMVSVGDAAQYLFNNPLLSDITFKCRDAKDVIQQIHAHSFVLVMRSPVFYDEFHGSIGKSQEISIDDFSYETFFSFMRYLYGSDFVIDKRDAAQLYFIGQKYEVDCLLNDITNVQLSIDNICDYLEMSIQIENEPLTKKIMALTDDCGKQLIGSESFKTLSPDALKEILLRDQEIYDVSEIELFESVIQWAEHRCQLNKYDINPINMRRSLGDLIKLIRFTAMTPKWFAECTQKYDGLLSGDEKSSLYFSIVMEKPDENDLGFLKPRVAIDMNLDLLKINRFCIDDNNWSWRKCLSHRSIFIVSSPIYVTHLDIAPPIQDLNFTIAFGIEGSASEQLKAKGSEFLINYKFKKPMKLMPGQQYYCDIKYNDPGTDFACRTPKDVPFTKARNDVAITFFEWSPLLQQIYFKKKNN